MARRLRTDPPGSWHHVVNRGIARRSVFEERRDVRYFLAGIARSVRRGQLEVHAWCVMTTHYHLLVRSPAGQLSDAMHRIQNTYSRYFNRSRRRDGPLFRGRFVSRLVDSMAYRRAVLSYIDANPVEAGLCEDPWTYPWGSARQYVEGSGPLWLQRNWVEGLVAERSPTWKFDPRFYPASRSPRRRASIARVVASRLQAEDGGNEIDSLLEMASPAVREWLQRKAACADGDTVTAPYVDASDVGEAIEECRIELGEWTVRRGRLVVDAWPILHAGLLRQFASASLAVAGRRLGVVAKQAARLIERHNEFIASDDEYADRATRVAGRLLDAYRGPLDLAAVAGE